MRDEKFTQTFIQETWKDRATCNTYAQAWGNTETGLTEISFSELEWIHPEVVNELTFILSGSTETVTTDKHLKGSH
jgi:hypothetical protein